MGDAKRQDIATGELVDLELIRRFIVVVKEVSFRRIAPVPRDAGAAASAANG